VARRGTKRWDTKEEKRDGEKESYRVQEEEKWQDGELKIPEVKI
jgi:hypothetical protein